MSQTPFLYPLAAFILTLNTAETMLLTIQYFYRGPYGFESREEKIPADLATPASLLELARLAECSFIKCPCRFGHRHFVNVDKLKGGAK